MGLAKDVRIVTLQITKPYTTHTTTFTLLRSVPSIVATITAPYSPAPKSNGKSSDSIGWIIGVVFGLLAIILVLVCCVCRKRGPPPGREGPQGPPGRDGLQGVEGP